MNDRVIRACIEEGIPYSRETKCALASLDSSICKNTPTKEAYMQIEEQLSAVIACYEEEAFRYGFTIGIQLLISSLCGK